jgi:hypothetical protein
MEGLNVLTTEQFQVSGGTSFAEYIHEFNFIKIRLENDTPITTPLKRSTRAEFDLELETQLGASRGGPSTPDLKLVQIWIGNPIPIGLQNQLFSHIFESFHLNPYILHLMMTNSYGFHQFPDVKNGGTSCFYLGTIMYMLAWSFNSNTRESRAILLIRKDNGFLYKEDISAYFFRILTAFSGHMRSSKFLGLTALTQLVHFLDRYIYHCLYTIKEIEESTGYGDVVPRESVLTLDKITLLSKKTGRYLAVVANIRRHLHFANDLIAHIKSKSDQRATGLAGAPETPDQLEDSMMEAASVLERSISSNEAYVNYLFERAKSQMTVLQGLITHEDATLSIALSEDMQTVAKKTAELSEKAVRDSSAMKTIAVMTMLFLPGTFFAAIFSMPLLKWDGSDIIQKQFWMYWAFTVPATMAVFVAWKILTMDSTEVVRRCMRWL